MEGLRNFLVAAEDRSGYEAVKLLVDRLLVEDIAWVDGGNLEYVRRWIAMSPDKPWLPLSSAQKKWPGLRPRGHLGGKPAGPDATMTRYVLLHATEVHHTEALAVLFLARDLDREPRRREGMQQAVDEKSWPFSVVLAWSLPESEAWYLAGFSPTAKAEEERLQALVRRVGFDPTRTPHRLSSGKGSKKDTKDALKALSAGDVDRERSCLQDMPIPELLERGNEAGLADFITRVRDVVVPLYS